MDLAGRVQALPAELSNHILEYVLETPDGIIQLDTHYRPPIALQLNRSIRDDIATQYYAKVKFQIRDRHTHSSKHFIKGWQAVVPIHGSLVRIHYKRSDTRPLWHNFKCEVRELNIAMVEAAHAREYLKDFGVYVPEEALRVNVFSARALSISEIRMTVLEILKTLLWLESLDEVS